MRFEIHGPFRDNLFNLMRKSGYRFLMEIKEKGEFSFIRAMGGSGYPRFHIHARPETDKITLTLHLDQKKPSYKGCKAHSGDYQGTIVEQEAQRIIKIVSEK